MNKTNATRLLITIPALAMLAACGTTAQTTQLPDGSFAYIIPCGGNASALNYCFEKAGKSCGAEGYTLVGQDGEFLSGSEIAESDLEALTTSWQSDRNSILVKCGT